MYVFEPSGVVTSSLISICSCPHSHRSTPFTCPARVRGARVWDNAITTSQPAAYSAVASLFAYDTAS